MSAAELAFLQAAIIAGITQSPTADDPVRHPDAAQQRRDRVLRLMHEQGYITSDEWRTGLAAPLTETLMVGEPQ